jgi:aldose sugar dehydrogenase
MLQTRLLVLSLVIIIAIAILVFQSHIMRISQKLLPISDSVLVFAQTDNKSISQNDEPIVNDKNLGIEVVAKGIKFPASMSFLDKDDILVTEKNTGMVKRILNGTVLEKPVVNVSVINTWESGLLGIAIDKDTTTGSPRNVYLYYSTPIGIKDGADYRNNQTIEEGNLLYRYEYDDGKLVNPELLLKIPYPPNFTYYHPSGAVLIGPDKNIYLVAGDFDQPVTKAQNVDSNLPIIGTSAIYRLAKDGSAAKGNPFGGEMSKYYAYGVRNSFGMDFDPVTGKLWDTENGPWWADEINIVEPGFNSGWKKIQGLSYIQIPYAQEQGKLNDLVNFDGKAKYSEPEFVWAETLGVTAIKFLNSNKLGQNYENDVFVGDFDLGNIYHFDLINNRTALSLANKLEDKMADNRDELQDVIFGHGFGAVVDIEVGPDGYRYILSLYEAKDKCDPNMVFSDCYDFSSNDVRGSIFRIVPKNK